MTYDPDLAERVRRELPGDLELEERSMFGGLAFFYRGNMCCGLVGEKVMLRLGKEGASEALERPDVEPMDFTGRPMSTMVYLTGENVASDDALGSWLGQAVEFARTLPPKIRGCRGRAGL